MLIELMLLIVRIYRMKVLNAITEKKLMKKNHQILILMLLQCQEDILVWAGIQEQKNYMQSNITQLP